MPGKIQAIRGMHDILPDQAFAWRHLENSIIAVINSYCFQEIRIPVVEKTELFARSIGESSDIVAKEMYTFTDRNDDSLSLRPEGTAGCVRAGLEHGLFHNQVQKLWYIGPMFRHERPQKGRQRQFHQIGLEAFGSPGPDIDAELIMLCTHIWETLKLDKITLQLNTLGTATARIKYKEILVEYLSGHKKQLDEDSQHRLHNNPLRILDSKNPDMQKIISGAPTIQDYLDTESSDHFTNLRAILDESAISYTINPRLVRGLDYYCKTVFEWTTDSLGAQGTICAGGRYDGLVEHFGGKPAPAIGCAMGLERLMELVQLNKTIDDTPYTPQVYVILADEAVQAGLKLAEDLRKAMPGLRLMSNCGGGSFKSQFKKADKSGAILAIILGQEELTNQTVGVKLLRENSAQTTIPWVNLVELVKQRLA